MSPDKPRGRPRQETPSDTNTTAIITGHVYAVGDDGRVAEYRITRRTAKRTYFEIGSRHLFEVYVSRETLERDGSAQHVWEGQASRIYATRAAARKAAWRAGRRDRDAGGKAEPKPDADLIPAGITAIEPTSHTIRPALPASSVGK